MSHMTHLCTAIRVRGNAHWVTYFLIGVRFATHFAAVADAYGRLCSNEAQACTRLDRLRARRPLRSLGRAPQPRKCYKTLLHSALQFSRFYLVQSLT